jgi:hypothetical protein
VGGFGGHACQKRHNNLDSLKRSHAKVAAEIPLETVRAAIVEWPEGLKACVEAESGHFKWRIINKNLKLLAINYLARKVDVLFHFPSRSQYTWDITYGKTAYRASLSFVPSIWKYELVGARPIYSSLRSVIFFGRYGRTFFL